MEKQFEEDYEEALRLERRAKRREALRRKRRRQAMIRRAVFFGVLLVLAIAVLAFFFIKWKKEAKVNLEETLSAEQETGDMPEAENQITPREAAPAVSEVSGTEEEASGSAAETGAEEPEAPGNEPEADKPRTYRYEATDSTQQLGSEFASIYAVLVDVDKGTILTQKDAKSRINPASMTKVLTLLVAAEHVDNLDDTFTVTAEATDYGYKNDCSVAGFEKEETVTVRDLMYGTILPSGADAAMGLALYVSGSQEAFVELMNEKLAALGLSESAHFTNCVGIYDENHYCTAYDLAVIMNAAIENEVCREVLSAHTYNTSVTEQHPEGILLSNWFLRRIEDKDTGGEVVCGKTGFVNQSGSCAVSYEVDQKGRNYICVTAGAHSSWRCIYDHVELYKKFSEMD